jgi:hypothetical protein
MNFYNIIFNKEEKETIEKIIESKEEIIEFDNAKSRSEEYQLIEKIKEVEKMSEELEENKEKLEKIIKTGPERIKYITALIVVVPTILSLLINTPIINKLGLILISIISAILIHILIIMIMSRITPKLIQRYTEKNDYKKVSQFLKELETPEEKTSYLVTSQDLKDTRKVVGIKHGVVEEKYYEEES